MIHKQITTILLVGFVLCVAVFPAHAAPLLEESISPPGWLGALLAFASLALAFGVGLWVRRRG